MNGVVAPARIVVSTGTDHHHFDRLIDWVDGWLGQQTERPDCLVQYGSSARPHLARGVVLLSRLEMLELYRQADVVVVQGGPGSIFDARAVGHRPLTVPRLAYLDEVVDDHQVEFCHQLEREGEIILVEDQHRFDVALTEALARPASVRTAPRESAALQTAAALHDALGMICSQKPSIFSVHRARQVLGRQLR